MIGLPIVYDTGALVAAEGGGSRIRAIHREALGARIRPLVPAPVLAQAWRGGGPRQARLSRFLTGCRYEPTEESVAKLAGVLIGRSGHTDAVDAIVVALGVHRGGLIVTSDPSDIGRLVRTVDAADRPEVVTV